jgi:hypothetical protein
MASRLGRSNGLWRAGTRWSVALVTLAAGVPAFLLGRVIWPDTPTSVVVPPDLVPFFVLPSLLEALAFGAGVAFLVSGWRAVPHAAGPRRLAVATYVSTAWLLMAWWPHGNLHSSLGFDVANIAKIEWAIHLTVLLAAAVDAVYVARTLRAYRTSGTAGPARVPTVDSGATLAGAAQARA